MARIENWNPPQASPLTGVFYNTAEHAARVHEGETTKSGLVKPARTFMQTAVEEVDHEQVMLAEIDPNTLNVDEAFRELVEYVHDEIKANILDERWNWPRPTRRSNGEVVHTPRNIYDTGALYEGQEREVERRGV